MTARANTTLAAVGIVALKVVQSGAVGAYEAGRAARMAGKTLHACPYTMASDEERLWQTGWEIVDYKLKNPEPPESGNDL